MESSLRPQGFPFKATAETVHNVEAQWVGSTGRQPAICTGNFVIRKVAGRYRIHCSPNRSGLFFFFIIHFKMLCGYSENDTKFPESQTGSELYSINIWLPERKAVSWGVLFFRELEQVFLKEHTTCVSPSLSPPNAPRSFHSSAVWRSVRVQ